MITVEGVGKGHMTISIPGPAEDEENHMKSDDKLPELNIPEGKDDGCSMISEARKLPVNKEIKEQMGAHRTQGDHQGPTAKDCRSGKMCAHKCCRIRDHEFLIEQLAAECKQSDSGPTPLHSDFRKWGQKDS